MIHFNFSPKVLSDIELTDDISKVTCETCLDRFNKMRDFTIREQLLHVTDKVFSKNAD